MFIIVTRRDGTPVRLNTDHITRYFADAPLAPDQQDFETYEAWEEADEQHSVIVAKAVEVCGSVIHLLDEENEIVQESVLFLDGLVTGSTFTKFDKHRVRVV